MYDINEQIVTYKAGLTRLLGYYELQYSIGQTGILVQDSTHWTVCVGMESGTIASFEFGFPVLLPTSSS